MSNKHICGNCQLYDSAKGQCKVAILIEGEQKHMPVFPSDRCHIEELGIEVNQVRWFVEDVSGKPAERGVVKIEYPLGFFGEK